MEKVQAQDLIKNTFNKKFDKDNFRKFIINFLDGLNEEKYFSIGQAQVKECYRQKILSYQRIGQYTDNNGKIIDALVVHLSDNCSLDRNRTFLRNFVADYMRTRQKENTLVAFYNDKDSDWRFSFVKLEISLKQNDKGVVKVVNEFTPAKRYSFLVGELEPNHTAQSRLVELLIKDYPSLEEIEEAFNVEKVSKEFFANYKELFLQLVDDLKNIRANDDRINTEFTLKSITEANFCKKLLGQLVFLYFIQKKGWLGVPKDKNWGEGDKQFLRHTFERAVNEGKNFFNDYLEPLFYDALANGERDEQYFNLLDCKIPFLNGGLFETIGGYSWVDTDIILDNTIFSNSNKTKAGDIGDGILDVFDRYNFTVKEDEPLEKEVAVDPEMLGKVFEELLEVQDRKSKGAFYTPREIVHYMCQESLINYLCTELNVPDENSHSEQDSKSNDLTKQDISDFIHHSDKFSERENIATQKDDSNSVYVHILSDSIRQNAQSIDRALENIKICDPAIGSGAFPVGMLNEIVRARIALVDSGFLKEAKKRSVYEYKRQAIQNSIYGVDIEPGAVEIAKLRLWLSLVVEEDDITNIKALPNLDYKIVCGNSLLNVPRTLFNDSLYRRLEELKPQFFNETRKGEKRRLKKEIDAIIKELTKDGTFDFEIYFSEVFHEKGGFDIVIANPPYVQIKQIKFEDRRYFEKIYSVATGRFNLFYLFIEKTKDLMSSRAISMFIVPDRLLLNTQAENLRNFILNKQKLLEILTFDESVFENAVVDSVIIAFQNMQQDSYFVKTKNKIKIKDLEKMAYTMIISSYFNDSPNRQFNLNFDNKINNIQKKIKINTRELGSIADVKDGIIQGKIPDKLFIKKIIDKDSKPLLFGENINRYTLKFDNNWVNYKPNEMMKIELQRRGEGVRHGLWMRTPEIFEREKILTRQTADKIIATIDNDNYYYANTIHGTTIINHDFLPKYVLAILNSSLITWYYQSTTAEEGKVFAQIKINLLKLLPIRNAKIEIQNEFILIVNKILELTQSDNYLENQEKQNAVKEYEKQIDLMVYKLYDLTYEEVKSIDKDFIMSEEQYANYQL